MPGMYRGAGILPADFMRRGVKIAGKMPFENSGQAGATNVHETEAKWAL